MLKYKPANLRNTFIKVNLFIHNMIHMRVMLQSDIGRKTINQNFTSMSCYTMRRDGDHAVMIVR